VGRSSCGRTRILEFDFRTRILKFDFHLVSLVYWGTVVAQWLRYSAANQKVAGSNPGGVMEFFIDINPSDRTMALGSTQPLTEMSTPVFPGGKCGRCVRLTTLPPSCAVVTKSGNLIFLEPCGPPQACNGTALPFISLVYTYNSWWCVYAVPSSAQFDLRRAFKNATSASIGDCLYITYGDALFERLSDYMTDCASFQQDSATLQTDDNIQYLL
jgi:hypothetical protein